MTAFTQEQSEADRKVWSSLKIHTLELGSSLPWSEDSEIQEAGHSYVGRRPHAPAVAATPQCECCSGWIVGLPQLWIWLGPAL